ncbi:GNAT family N-acetyltransferase [Glycomyces sp. NPDC048151]|uniref:GNAT family N-acetyltransferase n=1 Tax=Glycomyces sp. NPDC048151 TaxID=3364002 RepID=UPI003720CF61
MVNIELRRFAPSEAEALADFLSGEVWPFHGAGRVDRADVLRRAAEGYYENDEARTFWIFLESRRAGMVRLFDLGDDTPLFDLRVSEACRGRGVGTQAVRWLTSYVFTELPGVGRIEGTTRRDNAAMRTVFRRCGFVKEGHFRQGWPDADGVLRDAVAYAVLRRDWETGTVTPVEFDDEP